MIRFWLSSKCAKTQPIKKLVCIFRHTLRNHSVRLLIFSSLIFFISTSLFSSEPFKVKKPSNWEYSLAPAGFALFFTYEFFFKEKWGPKTPRWIEPPKVDRSIRSLLVWDNSNMKYASLSSDILLFGVFGSSIFLAPLFINNDEYAITAIIMAETAAVTSLSTLVAKLIFSRKRPYSYFGTRASKGVDDNFSFFSGHSSFTFSLATVFSTLASRKFPKKKLWFYSISYSLAALTAYLRIAGDKHYFTDVATGALVGSTLGYLYSRHRFVPRIVTPIGSSSAEIQVSLYSSVF